MTDLRGISCKNLPKRVDFITGIEKSSVSPSDVWFVEFWDEGAKFEGKLVEQAVMKVFFSFKSFDSLPRVIQDATDGLEYESLVYQKITQPMLDDKVVPSVVTLFNTSDSCSYKDMINIIDNGLNNKEQAEQVFERNFALIGTGYPFPAIHDINKSLEEIVQDKRITVNSTLLEQIREDKFSYIMLRKFTPLHKSLEDYLNNLDFVTRDIYDMQDFWTILFQIAVGCLAMEYSLLTHNDLHENNIIIEKMAEEQVINQIVYGKEHTAYHMHTDIRTVIFDFDRAYCESIGSNHNLDDYCAEYAGYQCKKP